MSLLSKVCWHGYLILLTILSLEVFIFEVKCTSQVENHLKMGIEMLGKGQLLDALSHFHAAIDVDPKNYMSYYRRATVYLALGRSRPSLNDLDEVIRIKPDFTAARTQRASILVKLGRLDEAFIDLENILAKEPTNEAANMLFYKIQPLTQKLNIAKNNFEAKYYGETIAALTEIIEECPWDYELRELRVESYLAIGEIMLAISDLRAISKLTQDNTSAFLKLSKLYYQVGDVDPSLMEIRECLKLDPDHQSCFEFYKKVKKVAKLINKAQDYKNAGDHNACSESSKKVLKEEPMVPEIRFLAFDKLCQCERKSDIFENTLEYCKEALLIREEARLYCDMAEVYILQSKYEEAIIEYQNALRIDEALQRAKEGIDRAKKLQKQASKRDYYKILGVNRNASKKEITKAYRSLAQKWHPDHYDGEEKKEAEKRFIEIASAKEVLTNEEKRAMFDNGQDPLDPEQQQNGFGGGFNPFEHFAFHQEGSRGGGGGGPFHFKYEYH